MHYYGRKYKTAVHWKGLYTAATIAVQCEDTVLSELETAIVGEEETFEFRFEEGDDAEVEAGGKR